MRALSEIPARKGKAAFAATGDTITIVNTHGEQVVDTWAFFRDDLREFMSMEHTRASSLRLIPRPGDRMLTNRRRPILTWLEDTSGGIHDTLIAACDEHRYRQLGATGHHDNCTENLCEALAELGLSAPEVPCPLNLFMNIPWSPDGRLRFEPPPRPVPGGSVVFRAELDLVVVFSACPQDLVPINGRAARPVEAHFAIM